MEGHRDPVINVVKTIEELILEEKQRILRGLIASFKEHGPSAVVEKAEILLALLGQEGQGAQESAAAVVLRKTLNEALNSTSWFWNYKPRYESAYKGLCDLAAQWPLNNLEDNGEADDPISLSPIGCPLFAMRTSPLVDRSQLQAMLGEDIQEAYVRVGDNFFYVNKYKDRYDGVHIRGQQLNVLQPHTSLELKQILELAVPLAAFSHGKNYQQLSPSLRQIQMHYITQMTGHNTHNRVILPTGRQRDANYFLNALRNDPRDPETREIYEGKNRDLIESLARERYFTLHGNYEGARPIFNAPEVAHAERRNNGNNGRDAQQNGGDSFFTWSDLTMVVGFGLYIIGLIGLCLFPVGALALASAIVFCVGAALTIGGLICSIYNDLTAPAPDPFPVNILGDLGAANRGRNGAPRNDNNLHFVNVNNQDLVLLFLALEALNNHGAFVGPQQGLGNQNQFGAGGLNHNPFLFNFNPAPAPVPGQQAVNQNNQNNYNP